MMMMCHSLLLAITSLSLLTQDTTQHSAASIYGRITSLDTTAAASTSPAFMAIASVVIDVKTPGGEIRQNMGDDTGAYALTGLEAGVYTLRFARSGYIPLTLEVRVRAQGAVHLDVTLDRAPPTMQTIKVLAQTELPRIAPVPNATGAYRPWRLEGGKMRALSSLDFPDVIRAIGRSPDAPAGPESGAGIHLQGGATDHTQVLIDGIPLYNAVHAGDHPSAIDPDAVAEITSYSEPRARSGGRLSGVVAISTRLALPDSQHVVTSAWPTGIRTLAQVQVAGGSALIGARLNYARPLEKDEREAVTLRPNDCFATASVPIAGGALTGLFFSSADAISFDAAAGNPTSSSNGNRFQWSSGARALTWRHGSMPDRLSFEARVWQSATSVAADWIPQSAVPLRLADAFTQTATSASMSFGEPSAQTSLGVSYENLRSRYGVSDTARADAALLLGIGSELQVVSAYFEHTHDLNPRLSATVGERVAIMGANQLLFEPRAALAASLYNRISLSAAFARTHQFTQSLYNDESVIDAMASLEVPVVAGNSDVPIAASTALSAQLDIPLGSNLVVSARGFVRSFDDVVLAAPSTGDPFSVRSFAAGDGEAYGGTLGVRQQLARLDFEGAYTMMVVSREWAGEHSYRPSFAPSHEARLAVGYRLGNNTLLRASGFMTALRSTSPVLGAIAWQWQDVLATQREVSGSPQYSPEAVGAGRLEPYVRVDVGIRHNFTFGNPLRGSASVYLNVDNLLGRSNFFGIVEDGAGMRGLGMQPRSISFGVGLGF
ncbi:MAG TPA: TonB-dependent receptor [Gemmatimonadaceae bacterium]|nr:TonB-dependent receptor [Gemmatimonadaceae bacterium]